MSGTTPTRHELIQQGQGLVRSLALRIHRNVPVRIDLDDLIAYGEVGLTEAAAEFDSTQGAQFTTFAYYRVRGAIYDGLSKMSWTGRSRYNRLKYERMATAALSEEGTNADDKRLESRTDHLGWFSGVTAKLGVVYLASQSDTSGGIRDSAIVDPSLGAPSLVARTEIAEKIGALIDELPEEECQLIRAVYFEGVTLKDAADRMGISKSWASRMHGKILEQMARSLRRLGAGD